MIRDPAVIGSLRLRAVRAAAALSIGLALWSGLAASQGAAQERAQDLAGQLEEISATLQRLEGQLAQLIEQQADLAAAVAALNEPAGKPAATARTGEAPPVATPAGRQRAGPVPQVLEIEVLGGVSDEELATIVAWVRQVHATYRSSHVVVEPVMPLDSADPAGQRRRLMDEAGRVIDHVFEELNQRIDISTLAMEPVPGPRLRLAISEA